MNTTAASLSLLQRGRVALAAVVALLLVFASALVATSAQALVPDASVTGSVTEASEAGLAVTIDFEGIGEIPVDGEGVSVALTEAGTESVVGPGTFIPTATIVDGAGSGSYTAPKTSLDRTKSYEALVWYAPGDPTPDVLVARAAFPVTTEQWDLVFGSDDDEGPSPAAPAVVVSKSSGLSPLGETITVTGTGFIADSPATDSTRPPVAPKNNCSAAAGDTCPFGGTYVVFGKWPTNWAPSESGSRPSAGNLSQRWGVHEAQFGGSINAGNGGFILPEDGSFELTFTVSDSSALEGNYGIYTYAGGGATYALFETFTPLAFAEGPQLSLSSTELDPAGDSLTITGTGFDISAVGLPSYYGCEDFATAKKGFYVQVGWIKDSWRPSTGGVNNTDRKGGPNTWFADDSNCVAPSTWTVDEDGTASFEVTFEFDRDELGELPEGARYAVFTSGAGGGTQAVNEVSHDFAFAEESETPEVPETPTTPTTPTLPGGSLRWGFDSAFVDYVTGPIAHGSVTLSGGATSSGGLFQFGQASGSTFDAETGTGSVFYTGAVNFYGHAGALDLTFSNPQIVVTSASSATLSVFSNGSRVVFATLNLAAGSKTTSNGAVTFAGVPATLTSAGASQVFEDFRSAGYALDPVTFTIGAASSAPAGSTGTIASAAPTGNELPEEPPATEGIEISDSDLAALLAGDEFTITGSGFQPGEEDILVVVYSTPELLGTVTADAAGVATWTGTLPASLADGAHTLTLQGSVNHGLVFELNRAKTTTLQAVGECAVSLASLGWGFKESFRVYLEGVAKGGWDLSGLAYEFPEFVWTGGSGAYSAADRTGLVSFGGTLRFHGHDGALDYTLTNAWLELDGDTGYLVFDVTGETQGGADVNATAVRFAEFSLAGIDPVDGVITITDATATLTAAGAEAFGTYPAGEELDPVSAVIPVGADCGATAEAPLGEEPGVAEDSAPVWPWIAGGLVLAALLAGGGMLIARSRKQTA